jgi:hypothetical protein
MADIKVYDKELQAPWSIERPHAPTDGEREATARQALANMGHQLVDSWNSAPVSQTFAYYNVNMTSIAGEWSNTSTDIWGESSWRGGGVAVGTLEYTVS